MIQITDKIKVNKLRHVLGSKDFEAYDTRLDRIDQVDNGYVVGVYGHSNYHNTVIISGDVDIGGFELEDEIIATYRNKRLCEIIKVR